MAGLPLSTRRWGRAWPVLGLSVSGCALAQVPAARGEALAAVPAAAASAPSAVPAVTPVPAVVVVAPRATSDAVRRRASTNDAARLLEPLPGISLYEAGGLSALPVLRGLADERIRILVDGMDLASACPNHMNSPLSYIDATRVDSVQVLAGVTPVSAGGDSIAGTLRVQSAPPRFAEGEAATLSSGAASAFYRSNGQARGASLQLAAASAELAVSYSGALARAGNAHAGGDFKAAGPGAPGRRWLGADEIGSSAYRAENHAVSLAARQAGHQLQLDASLQHLPYELYPNQRMDMTGNDSTQLGLRYRGPQAWGRLEARAWTQHTRHRMDMGPDRADYGTGMPMDTRAHHAGGGVQAEVDAGPEALWRLGAEWQHQALDDWWSPVGTGMMAPRPFWNVDLGQRERAGLFAEWEGRWAEGWSGLIGLRHDRVRSDAGAVQGYNADPIWSDDAAAFNARDRRRSTAHWDVSLLTRYEPDPRLVLEAGLARKTRSPSLYERYPWSNQAMATLMNNFVGDGNGYIGNPDLRPEVAHTLALSAEGRGTGDDPWSVRLDLHATRVSDYIDAQRCTSAMCGGAANVAARSGFVNLVYANQSARLQGLDLSLRGPLGQWAPVGALSVEALASVIRGRNTESGDDLYHQMPPQLRLALTQRQGAWTQSLVWRAVAEKRHVSAVRNEQPTPGHALLDWRASLAWAQWRLDLAVVNVFDRAHVLPLGGAYLGQGASMSSTSLPWGVGLPGHGRSIDLALNTRF